MKRPRYTAQFHGQIESIEYRDDHGQLWLQCNFLKTWRLHCEDTAGLPLARRKQVLENVCDYLNTKSERAVFVIDEEDEHRFELETAIDQLAASGHKLTFEHTSAGQRRQFEKGWQRAWLQAGKKLRRHTGEVGGEHDET